MPIGMFDSGVGGITVLKQALNVIHDEDFIYYADTKHVPYGVKSKEEVKKYVFDAVSFLDRKGIKILVIACNTATSIAVNDLRKIYKFPIIGMEPAIKPAIKMNGRGKRVLVLATALTLKEAKFRDLVARVDSNGIVDYLPMPELVELAEKAIFHESIIVPLLREKLSGLDLLQYSTIVLGCTHFPFYRRHLKEVVPEHISIIDGNEGTVNNLYNTMIKMGLKSGKGTGNVDFYLSGQQADENNLSKFKLLLDLV